MKKWEREREKEQTNKSSRMEWSKTKTTVGTKKVPKKNNNNKEKKKKKLGKQASEHTNVDWSGEN